MTRMTGQKLIAVIVLIFGFLTSDAIGQDRKFPVQPINLYVGFSPGGGTTLVANLLCEGMKKYLNQPVILNFKPGASQTIAAQFVINSAPDGYTLFLPSTGDFITKIVKDGHMLKFLLDDFDSLGAGPSINNGLVINADSPWQTIDDLVVAAKKSPGKLKFGTSGFGHNSHLIGELIQKQNGITLNHIPFAGAGPMVTALLGNHIDMGISTVSTWAEHAVPGGKLRALLIFDPKKRIKALPNCPTAVEKGMDITINVWWSLMARKGLPKTVRDTLIEAFKNTVEDPQIMSGLNIVAGGSNIYLTPEETNEKVQAETRVYQSVWKMIEPKN